MASDQVQRRNFIFLIDFYQILHEIKASIPTLIIKHASHYYYEIKYQHLYYLSLSRINISI